MSGDGRWWRAHPRQAEGPWRAGNRIELLENGEEFFVRAFEAIAEAREEVLIETFILFEDKVGQQLQQALIAAAGRGVRVEITVDGYGSPSFSDEFLAGLADAGVRFRAYDQQPTLLGVRTNLFRRMHRKLLLIDRRLAFVGGINYSADHLADFGPTAKQDYAVELEGPIVADIHGFAVSALASDGSGQSWRPTTSNDTGRSGDAEVMFVVRDNRRHTTSIEREYRRAIRAAKREVVIANAYFFPGYGFLRDLRDAARRGVRVQLLVQGEPDTPMALHAARMLYRSLVEAGVCIHEYCERPFHGKVAWVDEDWATVGSSNLDPLSLSLNLEANVFVRDRDFVQDLRAHIDVLVQQHCNAVDPDSIAPRRFWHRLTQPLLFHVLRRFPRWAGLLPAHLPKTALLQPTDEGAR